MRPPAISYATLFIIAWVVMVVEVFFYLSFAFFLNSPDCLERQAW